MLVRSLVFTALVLAATVGLIFAGGPSCAWGFMGCGEGTNECRYDCPGTPPGQDPTGMNCMRSGNPFEMCYCDGMFCATTLCDDVET